MNKAKSNKRRNNRRRDVFLFAEIVINYLLQLGRFESIWRHSPPAPRKRIQIHANMIIDELVGWLDSPPFRTLGIIEPQTTSRNRFQRIAETAKWIFGYGWHNGCRWIIFCELHPRLPNLILKLLGQYLECDANRMNVKMKRFGLGMFNKPEQNNSCSLEIIVAKFFPSLTKCFDVCNLWTEIKIIPNLRLKLFFEIIRSLNVVCYSWIVTALIHVWW